MFETLRDFRRTWPQLLVTDLLFRAIAFLVLTPAVGLLLAVFLLRTDTRVLSDQDIVFFVLSPFGLVALTTVGAVSLGILFAEHGVLQVIGFGAVEDRRVTWLEALRCVFVRASQLGNLAGHVLVRLLVIVAPYLAALVAIHAILLGRYDINYYLARTPPEFRQAVLLAGLLAIPVVLLLAVRIASWILAIPLVLFEGMSGSQALRTSGERTRGHRIRVAIWILGWAAAVFLLSTAVSLVVGLVGDAVVPRDPGNVPALAVGLAVVLLLSGSGGAAVSVLATMMLPLLIVRLYRSVAGPGELPRGALRGSLGESAGFRIPGRWLLAGVAAALAAAGIASHVALGRIDAEDHAVIIAHRGDAAKAPENTMAAFESAIEAGADWIELDVQENADGVVVVQHDRDLMRMAGVDLQIADATSEDLSGIDVGSWFAPEFADQRVPTLREALDLARGRVGVFVELKYYGLEEDLEARVVDVIEQAGMGSEIVVMSLKYDGVRRIAGLRPDWVCGLLTTVSLGDVTRLDLDFLAVNSSTATRGFIRRARSRGLKVYVWTVNDPVQMSVMMSRGVDGLITDEPELVGHVMRLREQFGTFGRLVVQIAGETGLLRGLEEVPDE